MKPSTPGGDEVRRVPRDVERRRRRRPSARRRGSRRARSSSPCRRARSWPVALDADLELRGAVLGDLEVAGHVRVVARAALDAWRVIAYVPSRPVSGTFTSDASVPKGESASVCFDDRLAVGPVERRSRRRAPRASPCRARLLPEDALHVHRVARPVDAPVGEEHAEGPVRRRGRPRRRSASRSACRRPAGRLQSLAEPREDDGPLRARPARLPGRSRGRRRSRRRR